MTRAARTEASLAHLDQLFGADVPSRIIDHKPLSLAIALWTLVLAGLQAAANAAVLLDVARAFA
jgi:hypothetical protein